MNLKRMLSITENFGRILMQEFEFNGMKIRLNYAARAKHAKNWVLPPHYHPWFEFNYLSKGSLYTTINGAEFYITAGDSYIIPPGVTHSHRGSGIGDDGLCIRFSLTSASGNQIVKALSEPYAAPFNSGIEKVNAEGGIYSVQAKFLLWVMQLYDTLSGREPAVSVPPSTFSAQVIMYMNEYFAEKISVNDIANAMNTSYRTLARKFNEETGMSVSEKLTEIRLGNAKKMLISTDKPIYKIAAECGYENEFYFSKAFKQREKITPSRYREEKMIK